VIILTAFIFTFYLIQSTVLDDIATLASSYVNAAGQTALDRTITMWTVGIMALIIGLIFWGFASATRREDDQARVGGWD